MSNLDFQIQKLSYELAQALEDTEINKLLGVLANDGVYAMWVFSLDKVKDDITWTNKLAEFIKILNLVPEQDFSSIFHNIVNYTQFVNEVNTKNSTITQSQNSQQKKRERIARNEIFTKYFQKLSEKLTNLLFFKEAMEQLLTYARYHKKAL